MRAMRLTAQLRPMTEIDTEPAAEMLRRGDWGERLIFFDWAVRQPTLIPIVADMDGAVIGTGVGSIHGSVGWVGTIFVEPEHRRSGLGRALTKAVCDALEARGCRSLVLIASDMGRPLYAEEGFRVLEHQIRFSIDGLPSDPAARDPLIREYRDDDLNQIVELDRYATGEERRPILASLLNSEATLVALDADGGVAGYLARAQWRGGALIAPDPDVALRLLEARRRSTGLSGKAGAGLLASNVFGRARLREAGWLEESGGVRMIRGEPLDWHPEAIWGQFNGALG